MATPVEDLVSFVAANGHGVEGASLFRDVMPEGNSDDLCVAVIGTPGPPSQGQFGSSALKYEFPRAQVQVRGPREDAGAARTKAYGLYKLFGAIENVVINGTRYHHVTVLQVPFKLKDDGQGRPIFAFNLEAEKEVG